MCRPLVVRLDLNHRHTLALPSNLLQTLLGIKATLKPSNKPPKVELGVLKPLCIQIYFADIQPTGELLRLLWRQLPGLTEHLLLTGLRKTSEGRAALELTQTHSTAHPGCLLVRTQRLHFPGLLVSHLFPASVRLNFRDHWLLGCCGIILSFSGAVTCRDSSGWEQRRFPTAVVNCLPVLDDFFLILLCMPAIKSNLWHAPFLACNFIAFHFFISFCPLLLLKEHTD